MDHLENRNTIIYFGTRDTDEDMARSFREVVQQDSFNILSERLVFHDSTEWLFDYLTEKQPVVDSLGVEVKDEEGLKMEELVIATDSIGSIFLATFDFKIASEVLSAVAERGDSIQIIGHGNWLHDKTANYQSLQDLGIWMLSPGFIDLENPIYMNFESAYVREFRTIPSQFVTAGYECILFSGYSLNRFGKYFQNGLRSSIVEGVGLYLGFDYTRGNDNQFIPVMKFEELELRVQNRPNQGINSSN